MKATARAETLIAYPHWDVPLTGSAATDSMK
jgi:hypothetical protein